MSQSDADDAFEKDLADAGLLDSPLEGGDTTEETETPEGQTPATGTPGATPEGAAAETPPVAPTDDATIAGVPPDPTAEELSAKAVPFAFISDGKQNTIDVIREIPGEGLVIEQVHVEKFRNMIQTADKALRDNVELRAKEQRYDQLGGTEKYRELEGRSAALDAMGSELLAIMNNPERLIDLATNPTARENLMLRLEMKGNASFAEAAQKFGASLTAQDTAGRAEANDGTAFDLALDSIGKALQKSGITLPAEDWQAARAHFGAFKGALYRISTAADTQQYGIPAGQRMIDIPLMHPWFEDRAKLRQSQSLQEQNRTKAENENRLRNPAPTPAPRKPVVANRTPRPDKKHEPQWKDIKNAWLSGRHAIDASD